MNYDGNGTILSYSYLALYDVNDHLFRERSRLSLMHVFVECGLMDLLLRVKSWIMEFDHVCSFVRTKPLRIFFCLLKGSGISTDSRFKNSLLIRGGGGWGIKTLEKRDQELPDVVSYAVNNVDALTLQ